MNFEYIDKTFEVRLRLRTPGLFPPLDISTLLRTQILFCLALWRKILGVTPANSSIEGCEHETFGHFKRLRELAGHGTGERESPFDFEEMLKICLFKNAFF